MRLLEALWRSRPPVSPWWMYCWLRDWTPRRGVEEEFFDTAPTGQYRDGDLLGVLNVGSRPPRNPE